MSYKHSCVNFDAFSRRNRSYIFLYMEAQRSESANPKQVNIKEKGYKKCKDQRFAQVKKFENNCTDKVIIIVSLL